jgi:hypothetical protein
MPKVVAYQGVLRLSMHPVDPEDSTFEKTVKVFGETLGQLQDNLVFETRRIAEFAEQVQLELDANYWSFSVSYPAMLDIHEVGSDLKEQGMGTAVKSPADIMRAGIGNHHSVIFSALNELAMSRKTFNEVPRVQEYEDIDLYLSSEVSDVYRGMSPVQGEYFDKALVAAQADGTLEGYRQERVLMARYHEISRKHRIEAAKPPRRKLLQRLGSSR